LGPGERRLDISDKKPVARQARAKQVAEKLGFSATC
jgi:hypothetical protein